MRKTHHRPACAGPPAATTGFCLAWFADLGLWAGAAVAAQPAPPLQIEQQGRFFIGGRQVQSETLGIILPFSQESAVTVDQMYVHYQVPLGHGDRPSLVFVHGCCLTGASWETSASQAQL